jgi:hypothetical protein
VFLHIPKCAGSSVNLIFERTIGSSRSGRTVLIDDRIDTPEYAAKVARARTARFVGGHFGFETLEKVRGDDAITFTVLRDPFDRIRSTHGHFHTRAKGNPLGHEVPAMTIEDYLASGGLSRRATDGNIPRDGGCENPVRWRDATGERHAAPIGEAGAESCACGARRRAEPSRFRAREG